MPETDPKADPAAPPEPTNADRAETVLRSNQIFLAFGRLITGNDALTEENLVALVRAKLR